MTVHTLRRGIAVLACIAITAMAWGAGQGEGAAADASGEITVTVLMSEHPSSPINPSAPAYEEIRRRTGIALDIEAVPSSDYSQKKNILLATGQMPDIARIDMADVIEFGTSRVFLPLLEPIGRLAPNLQRLIDTVPGFKKQMVDGDLYFIPRLAATQDGQIGSEYWFGRQPMIREDVLIDNGLEMPETIEELHMLLRRLKEIYPDKHIWTNRTSTVNLINCTAYPLGSGGHGMYYDQDVGGGRWVFGNVTDDFRTYVMAFYRQLYDEGILDPDFAINTSDQWHEKLGSGKSLFFYDNMSFAVNYNRSLRQNDPDAGFTPIPIMENEKGQRRNFFYTRHWWGGGWGVSAETEYPDRIVELFDWMVDTEGFEVTNYGIEGEHYTKEGNEYFVNPDLIEKYGEMSDPFRSMRADVGTGLLQFAVLVSTKIWYLWDPPEVRGWYEMLAEDPGMREAVLEPVFTPDERDRLKVLRTEVDNLLVPAMDEVIIGNITLEEFAEVQQMARDAGADEVEEIYNRAEARLQ